MYVRSEYNCFERFDLKIQNVKYESVWIEISNKSSKNVVCGCIYRHPDYDNSDFIIYMENVLKLLAKENKEVYICGDFNIDLLKINKNSKYKIFCYYSF